VNYFLSAHAKSQAIAKGWTEFEVLMAVRHPTTVYKGNEAGQERRIRGDLVTVVNTTTGCVITCYANVIETPLRPDQISS
jgi:hypothetical protein